MVTPSGFSTRLPFDVLPCEGNDLLGLGDSDCVCVYVLATRSVGRSENCFTRFLNWSWFLLTSLDSVGLSMTFVVVSLSCCCMSRVICCFFSLSCFRNLSRRESQTLLALSGCSIRWRQKMGRAGAKSRRAFCRRSYIMLFRRVISCGPAFWFHVLSQVVSNCCSGDSEKFMRYNNQRCRSPSCCKK